MRNSTKPAVWLCHVFLVHNEYAYTISSSEDGKSNSLWDYDQCDYVTDVKGSLVAHEKYVHGNLVKDKICPYPNCTFIYFKNLSLATHVKAVMNR